MVPKLHRLTARQVATAAPPHDRRSIVLNDGANLLLQVSRGADGAINRSWIFRFELDGRRHDLGLGPLRDRTLAEARDKARELRQKLRDGIDPAAEREQRKAERVAQEVERAKQITFKQCAERCIQAHADGWRNAEHHRQWHSTLEQYVFPVIGNLPVGEIDVALVVKTLEPVWRDIPETASRIRGRIEKVLGWATVRGFRSGDNPARWRGHLQELFAAKAKLQPTRHHAALPYAQVPALTAELRRRDHLAAHALEFTILTAARAGEVLGATGSEVDVAARTWTIPAGRMKAAKEHRVPLSDRALELIGRKPANDRLFALGERAMLTLLQELRPGMTVHGLRSSFRDWCSERTSYPEAVCEQALAHSVGSKVERAYSRTDLFEKRRRLMTEWAKFCASPVVNAEVVSLAR
jgi:integrase